MFVSVYLVNQLSLSDFKEWPYVGDVLWDSEGQSDLITKARCSRGVPSVGHMPLPVVVRLQLLLQCTKTGRGAWACLSQGTGGQG